MLRRLEMFFWLGATSFALGFGWPESDDPCCADSYSELEFVDIDADGAVDPAALETERLYWEAQDRLEFFYGDYPVHMHTEYRRDIHSMEFECIE